MDLSLITFLKDWVIPLGSVFLSIWFAASAKKDAEKADQLLAQITAAIQGWQSQIMNSATNILDSLPQVIEGRNNAARMQAIESLLKVMQERSSNQEGLSAHSYEQTMNALTNQISLLLENVKKDTSQS
jgi:hypothetical protein